MDCVANFAETGDRLLVWKLKEMDKRNDQDRRDHDIVFSEMARTPLVGVLHKMLRTPTP